MVAKRERWISPDEYLAYDRASLEAKFEYVDGYMYPVRGGLINSSGEMVDLAGGKLDHAQVAANIYTLLRGHLRDKPCRVYSSDVRVQVTQTRYFYPDVTVSCNQEDWQGRGQEDAISSPCLIVEVLSPSTEAYDRGRKFGYYRACPSIQGYVLISTQYQEVEIYYREGEKWIYRQFEAGQEVELASFHLAFPLATLYEFTEIPETPTQDSLL